jgi:GNAT superfamily N-acetyltransferase
VSPYLRIEPLAPSHDRSSFQCGAPTLERYFREQVSQDVKRRIATCFVATDTRTNQIAGFYTLAATSIALDALPADLTKKLPRYPVVPAALLGRLAVAHTHQGQGIGSVLLSDALIRTAQVDLGVYLMLVDAKDPAAQAFYERYGFRPIPGTDRRLSLPIATALQLLAGKSTQ